MGANFGVRLVGATRPIALDRLPSTGSTIVLNGTRYTVRGAYYSASAEVAGTTAAKNFASIYNPASSGKLVVLYAAILEAFAKAGAAESFLEACRITVQPTGGTAMTANKRETNDAAAIAEVKSGPTATSTANRLVTGFARTLAGDVSRLVVPDHHVFAEGAGALFHAANDSANHRISASFAWIEVS